MIEIELVMIMVICNIDCYSLFNYFFVKIIYDLMMEEGVSVGLKYFIEYKVE